MTIINICNLVGHSWRYKDYSNWMKENGEKYDFKAARKCVFCNRYEYLTTNTWNSSDRKSLYDVIGDSHLLKKLPVY